MKLEDMKSWADKLNAQTNTRVSEMEAETQKHRTEVLSKLDQVLSKLDQVLSQL